jgi:hypothetical protein
MRRTSAAAVGDAATARPTSAGLEGELAALRSRPWCRLQVRSDTPSLTRSAELQGTRQERRGSPICERENAIVVTSYEFGALSRAALRKFTIGLAGKFAPEQARILAKRLAGDVAHGIDPASTKTQKRNDPTVGELLDRYVREHIRIMLKPSTRWSAERLIKERSGPGSERRN